MSYPLYFISNSSNADNDLFQSLVNTRECYWITPDQLISMQQPSLTYLLIIDDTLSVEQIKWIQSHPLTTSSYATILYCKKTPKMDDIIHWSNISGYFLYSWPIEHKQHLLFKTEQGESCFSREFMKQLVLSWQTAQQINKQNYLGVKSDLTRKEVAILKQLHIGMSNLDMADYFYVSEHTIKSHLYRIFKKIQVKNRRQAIHWAQLYLSTDM